MIKENLSNVRENISESIKRAGRNPSDVTLIAVSKTKPLEDLLKAYNEGVRDFGENKVQEIMDKIDKMPSDTRFHMIGHLQKNKVKYIIGRVVLIHSVDNLELAEVIEKESAKKNLITDILIEINIANEETKFGVSIDKAEELIKKVSLLPHVKIKGLMAIAPYVDDPEKNRQHFVALRQFGIDINNQNIDNVSIGVYSMGMTGDYQVAIEEGSTMVRVGTGIFGARNIKI